MKKQPKSKATTKTKTKAEAPLPLAVPETVNPGLVNMAVPKLSKNELLTALVERARIKHEEEKAKVDLLIEQASNQLRDAVVEHLRDFPDDFDIRIQEYNCSVLFTPKVIPPRLIRLNEEWAAARDKRPAWFNADGVRRKIRESMDGRSSSSQRIKAVLGHADAIRSLDAALDAVMSPDVKTITA